MYGEISWANLDWLSRHYAAAAAYADNLHDLGRQITQFCSHLTHRSPSYSDLSRFLSPVPDEYEESVRAVSWLSQNVLHARAYGVNQKIVFTRGKKSRKTSPLIDQLDKLGIEVAKDVPIAHIEKTWEDVGVRNETIDTFLIDQVKRRIYLVKGQTTTAASRHSKTFGLLGDNERATLFSGENDRHVFAGVYAASDAVIAARFSAALLSEIVPDYAVIPVMITFEDHGGSGRFEALDLSECQIASMRKSRVNLHGLSVIATHEDYAESLERDPEALMGLPAWPGQDWLTKVPVDIPVRSIMLLKQIGERQRLVDGRLYLVSPRDLADSVSKKYGIEYSRDLWRHDILRLQRAHLLSDAPNGSSTVALSAAGLARLMVLEHRFNPMIPRPTRNVLDLLSEQEQRWAAAYQAI